MSPAETLKLRMGAAFVYWFFLVMLVAVVDPAFTSDLVALFGR